MFLYNFLIPLLFISAVGHAVANQKNITNLSPSSSLVTSNIEPLPNKMPIQRQGTLKEGEVYAIIIPVHEADISSGVNAAIKKIFYSPGESFKKGAKLLVFDCRNIEIDIKKAKAELQSAKTAYKSSQELEELKSISKIEFEKSKTEYEKALAQVDSLNYQLEKCQIIAPYDGEVVSKHANADENVKIDDPLFSIVSSKDFEVQMFVPSVWLNWLKKGADFTLKLQEMNKPLTAKVTKIAARVDPASQSVVIYGKLNHIPETLLAGMSGVATFNH